MKSKNIYFIVLFLYPVIFCSCVNHNNVKAVGTVSTSMFKRIITNTGENFIRHGNVLEKPSENKQDNPYIYGGSNGNIPPEVINVEMKNNVITVPVSLGKLKVNETKKFATQLAFPAKSVTTNSKDIIVKDSVDSSNKSFLNISITKTKPGPFSDTVNIVTERYQMVQVLSGEAVPN